MTSGFMRPLDRYPLKRMKPMTEAILSCTPYVVAGCAFILFFHWLEEKGVF
jgi:hypothetical protein